MISIVKVRYGLVPATGPELVAGGSWQFTPRPVKIEIPDRQSPKSDAAIRFKKVCKLGFHTEINRYMTTRLIKLLTLCILSISSSYGQTFEGKIVYANKYKSGVPNVSDQQFDSMMGTTQEYFIKGGNYKSAMDGTLMQWQLYVNKDNKLYTKMSNSPAVLWNDGAVYQDEITKTELNRNATEILGHPCDELIMISKAGTQKYYFSSDLKVDRKLFENHKFGNWNRYILESGALPLKISIENAQFTLECIAVEVKAMALDDKFFELPVDSKIEKSPY
jgi:hypothetical protein